MNPSLSIITATFNSQNTLAATIESVLNQSFQDFEYIIVDGASKDNTVDMIRSYESIFAAKGIVLKWISEPDKGIYDAWNKGLDLAKGRWISFVGSDDVLLPEAASTLSTLTEDDWDFLTARARLMRQGRLLRTFGEAWKWGVFRREMKILHAGGWHSAAYFKKYGRFDDSFRIVGDYELLLRAGKNLRVGFVDVFIIEMGGDGVSSTLINKSLLEAARAKVKNGIRSSFGARLDYYWVMLKIRLKTLWS